MSLMIVLGVGLRLTQERRADATAAKLKAMISVTAAVFRDGQPQELPVSHLVPGDVIKLAAGDMIPADVRIVGAKDLFVMQSSLTGESFPVEKFETDPEPADKSPIELANLAFLGTSVESGTATAVVVATGRDTYLGSMAGSLAAQPTETAFDKGVARFTWLMLRFILVMVPLVFVINGLTKGRWHEAFFFALAVAVGLTPEMLPMIVTVCLSKGAMAMAKKKVIVKRINAIQNLGAMDVLCTDKTGTLTMDHVILEHALRRRPEAGQRRPRARVSQQSLPDGPEERHGSRRSRARGTGAPSRAPSGVCQGGRNSLRLRAPHHVGRRTHARWQGPDHQQRGAGGDLPALQEL